MMFTIEKASNCDSSNVLMNNQQFLSVARQQGWQATKKLFSIFCCMCCCVDNPSSSLVLHQADKFGVPPKTLILDDDAKSQHFVISYVGNNADGIEEKTPLLFTNNEQVAKAILNELKQIYVVSSQMNVFGKGPSLDELDGQAQTWHQLFGLPPESRGTQQLKFNSTLNPGDSIVDAMKKYKPAPFTVKSLAAENPSAELQPLNRV